jgi:predicted MPP superfamily phosphohydrolase
MRKLAIVLLVLALSLAALILYARSEALRDPIVRTATIKLPNWPSGARPIRAVLISDLHLDGQTMDEARLDRIVAQIKALNPDIVLLAGDYIYGHDPAGAKKYGPGLVAPLSKLRPPLGVIAVLGNHDQWTGVDTVRAQLAQAGVTVLENDATIRGPIAIGGVGDDFSGHDNLAATLARLRSLAGARILLTHSPDIAPDMPADTSLLLAGHTHCGQIVLPLWGPISDVSRYGARYRCGVRFEGARTVIVTAGLGTSGPMALRLNAPPDLWLLTLGP